MHIPEIGKYGVVADIQPHLIPPGAWSDGDNVRFKHDRVRRMNGMVNIFPKTFEDRIIPMYWGTNITADDKNFWIMSDDSNELWVRQLGTFQKLNIRASDGNSVATTSDLRREVLWNSSRVPGYILLNNGRDIPFFWEPGITNPVRQFVASTEVNVGNEEWPYQLRARVLRTFGYFMVAFNLKYANEPRRGNGIKWSSPLIPGADPLSVSWDIDDPTHEAGEFDLNDSMPGDIVDAVQLRDWMMIYKRNSVWAMRYVGGNEIYAFSEIFTGQGALETNCITNFAYKGGQYHCVFTGDDAIIHDGRSVVNRLESKVANKLTRELNEDNWDYSYVLNRAEAYENWIVYSDGNDDYANKVCVWNYHEGTVSFLDLPEKLNWITPGIVGNIAGPATHWDSEPDMPNLVDPSTHTDWDDDNQEWDIGSIQGYSNRPVGFSFNPDHSNLFQVDVPGGNVFNSISRIKKTDFAYVPDRRTKEPMHDLESWKLLKGVRVQMTGDAELEVVITPKATVGGDELPGAPPPQRVSKDNPRIDTAVSGKAFDIEFRTESSDKRPWELFSYELDIEKLSTY